MAQEFSARIYGSEKTLLDDEAKSWANWVIEEYGVRHIKLSEFRLFFQHLYSAKVYGQPSCNTMAVEFKAWFEQRSLTVAQLVEDHNSSKHLEVDTSNAVPCPQEHSTLQEEAQTEVLATGKQKQEFKESRERLAGALLLRADT